MRRYKLISNCRPALLFLGMLCAYFLVITAGIAQGQYIDRVQVNGSNGESFAIYLPENFKPGDQVSILFVFAPDGVGKHGVTPFKEVADERKMIVVSSNDSRNGPYEQNLAYAQRLFNHIFSVYTIDPDQIFLSGFSGGSRLASAIASLSGNVTGVVACGAGFSGSTDHSPQSNEGYVWLGIVGDRDFNYKEMLDVSSFLKKLKYPHGLQLFSGNHRWPPPEEINAAFRFIELQMHKVGKVTLSRKHIENNFNKDCQRLTRFQKENDLIKVAAEYERMSAGYSQVRMIDSLLTEKNQFLQSPAYRSQKKKQDKALQTELALKRKFKMRFQEDFKEPDRANWKAWEKEINKLKKLSEDTAMAHMHSRVLYWVYVMTVREENSLLNSPTSAQLDFSKKIAALVRH